MRVCVVKTEMAFLLDLPVSFHPMANKAGERWCTAENPCIIQGPFLRGGSSLGTSMTTVAKCG